MKFVVAAFLLSSAIPSFGQASPQDSIDPDQIFQMPKGPLAPRDLNKAPAFKAPLQVMPLPRVVLPSRAPRVGDPQLDAEIIHRPLQKGFAQQQPRTPMAANLYPDLKLLPVETARLDATPAEWPKVKEEPAGPRSPAAPNK